MNKYRLAALACRSDTDVNSPPPTRHWIGRDSHVVKRKGAYNKEQAALAALLRPGLLRGKDSQVM